MTQAYFLIVTEAIVLVCGLWYAISPSRWLKKKYEGREIPAEEVRRARILGVVIAVAAAAFLTFDLVGILGANG